MMVTRYDSLMWAVNHEEAWYFSYLLYKWRLKSVSRKIPHTDQIVDWTQNHLNENPVSYLRPSSTHFLFIYFLDKIITLENKIQWQNLKFSFPLVLTHEYTCIYVFWNVKSSFFQSWFFSLVKLLNSTRFLLMSYSQKINISISILWKIRMNSFLLCIYHTLFPEITNFSLVAWHV